MELDMICNIEYGKQKENKMKATFKLDKEVKHSRRYATEDEKFPIKTIYVAREYADGKNILELEIQPINDVD